jgi:hypothetical protein
MHTPDGILSRTSDSLNTAEFKVAKKLTATFGRCWLKRAICHWHYDIVLWALTLTLSLGQTLSPAASLLEYSNNEMLNYAEYEQSKPG